MKIARQDPALPVPSLVWLCLALASTWLSLSACGGATPLPSGVYLCETRAPFRSIELDPAHGEARVCLYHHWDGMTRTPIDTSVRCIEAQLIVENEGLFLEDLASDILPSQRPHRIALAFNAGEDRIEVDAHDLWASVFSRNSLRPAPADVLSFRRSDR